MDYKQPELKETQRNNTEELKKFIKAKFLNSATIKKLPLPNCWGRSKRQLLA